MEWVVFPALLIFIMLATIGAMNLIGNINEKLCSIHSKQKKIVLNSFLRRIVPQRDLSISDYYRPPKKEAYLLTVILTIIDIILGISFSIAAVFVKIFTELNESALRKMGQDRCLTVPGQTCLRSLCQISSLRASMGT